MYRELTNLLPASRRKANRAAYFFRLSTVGVLLLAVLVVVSGILLIPTYLYLVQQVTAHETRIAHLDEALASSEEKEVNARLEQLGVDAAHLAKLSREASASGAIRAVLAVSRPGIILSGFTFTAAKDEGEHSMTVSGVASSRESLRRYDQALSELPFVSSAELPISAYAAERNIPFSIKLSGTLLP